MVNILIWVLFGIAAGTVAGWITKDRRHWISDMVVGVIGSFLAGWAGTGFKSFQTTSISFVGFLTSVLGAVVLIALLNVILKRR